MTADDDSLHTELAKDAAQLGIDAGAIRAELSRSGVVQTIENVADEVWPFIEPLLVGLATSQGGPIGGFVAKEAGDILGRKLHALAASAGHG